MTVSTCFLKVRKFSCTAHSSYIVKVFRMVGWPVLPLTCLLKVRKFRPFSAHSSYIYSQSIQDG